MKEISDLQNTLIQWGNKLRHKRSLPLILDDDTRLVINTQIDMIDEFLIEVKKYI